VQKKQEMEGKKRKRAKRKTGKPCIYLVPSDVFHLFYIFGICQTSNSRNSNCRPQTVDITNLPTLSQPKLTCVGYRLPKLCGEHLAPVGGCQERWVEFYIFGIFSTF
jgi:hypothetical protein